MARFWRYLTFALFCISLGCESRNPAQIATVRQGPSSQTPSNRETRAGPAPAINEHDRLPVEQLQRFDLAKAFETGTVSIEANDPVYLSRIARIFDLNTESLARSENVNPLILTFTFREAIPLRSVRIYPSYSVYDWTLQASPEMGALKVHSAPAEQWSKIDLPEQVRTLQVTLDITRLQRDNFVHLNEVEFYSE